MEHTLEIICLFWRQFFIFTFNPMTFLYVLLEEEHRWIREQLTEKSQLSVNVDTQIYHFLAENKHQQTSECEFSEIYSTLMRLLFRAE